ncbi:MAG: DNA polymerase III subunit epsilon [Burkholderiales bacterium]
MRQIVLDTETTGLNVGLGDRVVEIGAVEMVSRRLTGNHFHRYVNPERLVEPGALRVHGLTDEFLSDKPLFAEVAAEFLDFIRGGELVIHNAPFDVDFLNAELSRLDKGPLGEHCDGVIDTLVHARELHPGRKNSLDALCERYAINNAHRKLHGALLDAELLAEVYLAMTRGQDSLAIEMGRATVPGEGAHRARRPDTPLLVRIASDEERTAHAEVLRSIQGESKGRCVWLAGAESPA